MSGTTRDSAQWPYIVLIEWAYQPDPNRAITWQVIGRIRCASVTSAVAVYSALADAYRDHGRLTVQYKSGGLR